MNSKAVHYLYPALTIVLTVCAFIFYSMFVVNGQSLEQMFQGTTMLSHHVSLWVVFVTESILAYILEMAFGHPFSQKQTDALDKNTPAFVSRLVGVCATVVVMCPAMSLIAAILYFPSGMTFDLVHVLANWLKLVCNNLPFVFFLQLLFIQPALGFVFEKAGQLLGRNHTAQIMSAEETDF